MSRNPGMVFFATEMQESSDGTPPRSMTGFGRGVATVGKRTYLIEIRSLNHRGLDIKIRTQDCQLAPDAELEIMRLLRQSLVRGSVLLAIREEKERTRSSGLDHASIQRLHGELSILRQNLGLPDPVDLQTVAIFLSALPSENNPEILSSDWDALRPGVEKALQQLFSMRQKEGAMLVEDLLAHLAAFQEIVSQIREAASKVPSRAARRIQERIASIATELAPVDPARLAQEVSLLLDRFDVSEEILRLASHGDQMRDLLTRPQKDAPGRKLDFLAQEIGREVNTIGAKIQDSATLSLVVEAKAELEKLREQAQNIE